jgi:hypothetical protein
MHSFGNLVTRYAYAFSSRVHVRHTSSYRLSKLYLMPSSQHSIRLRQPRVLQGFSDLGLSYGRDLYKAIPQHQTDFLLSLCQVRYHRVREAVS